MSVWFLPAALPIVGMLAALWWHLPKWQVNHLHPPITDAKGRAEAEDNFRKTFGQLLGGVIVIVTAGLAYYGTQLSIQASNAQLISQQVSKGFQLLSNEELMARLGGIYALEGVMNASKQYHQPVLEELSAFVREHTKSSRVQLPTTCDDAHAYAIKPPDADIQAALTVIKRRVGGAGVVDLTDAGIYRALLNDGDLVTGELPYTELAFAQLSGAHLNHANLFHANLRCAYLRGADLTDSVLTDADLSGADLTDAKVLQSQLEKAACDKNRVQTKLPSGLTLRQCQ